MALFVIPKEEPDDDDGPSYPDEAIRKKFKSTTDFNNYLSNHFSDFAGKYIPEFDANAGKQLHLLPAVTELSQDGVIEKLEGGDLHWDETIDYGDAVTLLVDDSEKGTGAYLAMDKEDGYFILYSNLTKLGYVDSPLVSRFKWLPRTSRLHVSSSKLETLAANKIRGTDFSSSSAPYCDEVIFKRRRGSDVETPLGRKVKRTINYYGEDAAEMIPHITQEFGMSVSSLRLEIPGKVKFKINRDGVLKLESGPVNRMLKEISSIIDETLDVKKAYDDAETRTLELGDQKVSQSKPAKISFNQEEVDKEAIKKLFDAFAERDLVPLNRYIESDSLYFSTSVYYVTQKEYFDIRGDANSLRLFPRKGEKDLKTFFSVFSIIQEYISPNATVTVDTNAAPAGGDVQ
ncbi:hypothetical protein [Haloarchaeobius sp. DT45]|uniref:hypothetical protein n=1 Tax=Haloarchaeobius sp. DT45 TaxID=3446116 RepID=UPI003F6D03F1